MAETPTPLFLALVAGLGTALLSPLLVSGEPVFVLIIPFALLAAYLYNTEAGVTVGVGSSAVAGILTFSIMQWEIIAYAVAASVAVIAWEHVTGKEKNMTYLLIFAALGTILFELLYDAQAGQNILLRSEHFIGTSPGAGIRIIGNVFITWIAAGIWTPTKK